MDKYQQLLEKLTAISKGVAEVQETQRSFAKRLDDVEVRDNGTRPAEVRFAGPVAHFNGADQEKEKFSFAQAIVGIAYGNWGRGYEKRVFEEARNVREKILSMYAEAGLGTRDMSASADSLGGYWVPPQFLAGDFIPLLRAKLVVEAAGADVMDGLTGSPVELGKQTSASVASWVGENTAGTATDVGSGQVRLEPHEVLAATKLSNRLLRLGVQVETRVRDDLAKQIRLAIDLACLRGTGGVQPLGVAQTTGINTVAIGTNGGNFSFEIADKMRTALAEDNALDGSLAYISHPLGFAKARRERTAQFSGQTDGAYVILPMTDQMFKDTLGWQWHETTQLPTNLVKGTSSDCTEVYFGNWNDLILGLWGGLDLLASPVAADGNSGAFLSNQTWVRAIMEADVGIKHEASFCLVNDARTA